MDLVDDVIPKVFVAVILAMVAAAVIFAALQFIPVGRGYSEGERAGRLSKFSYKGIFYKSWEGELATGTVDDKGQAVGFDFSIINNSIAPAKVQELMGKPVKIKYVQWISTGLRYSSAYEIVDITENK